mgnify:CR=1 FL=1
MDECLNNPKKDEDVFWMDMAVYTHEIQRFARLFIHQKSSFIITTPGALDLLSRLVMTDQPMTPRMLSYEMGMSKASVSRLIARLTQQGFLTKQKNDVDERSCYLRITEEGKDALNKDYKKLLAPAYQMYRKLGREKFKVFMEIVEEANGELQDGKDDRS